MPVEIDEYGIPIKSKATSSDVDEYGILIKKKVGGNGNGSTSTTESNPFLAARRQAVNLPISNLSYAKTINANKIDNGSDAANDYVQKSVAAAEQSVEDKKWDAANNSAALYFKNNPSLLAKEKVGINTKNVTYSLKDLKKATAFQTKAAQIKNDIDNGKLTTYQTEEGEQRAAYPMEGLKNFVETFKQTWKASGEAEKVLQMDDETFKKYATTTKPDEDFLPTKANLEPSLDNISGVLGTNAPVLIRGGAGAAAGATIAAASEMTGGAALGGLAPIMAWAMTAPDIANQQAAQGKIKAYREALAQGHDENTALQIANDVSIGEYTKGMVEGTALNLVPAGLPKNVGQGVLKAVKEFAAKQPYIAGSVGLAAGGLTSLKNAYAEHLGLTIDEAEKSKEFNEAFNNMAGMQLAWNIVHGAYSAPGFVKAQAINAYSKIPPETRQELSQQAVEKGWITQEQADAANRNVAEFEAAKKTIIPTGNEEKDAVISGLIQKRKNLEAAKKNTDAAYHPEIDAQIEAANKRIQLAKDSNDPIRYAETDDVEGETNFPTKTFEELTRPEKNNIEVPKEFGVTVIKPNQNERFTATIESDGKVTKVEGDFASKEGAQKAADDILKQDYYDNELSAIEKPESKSKETKEPIQEGMGRSITSDERISTDETIKTEKDVGETLQPQQEEVVNVTHFKKGDGGTKGVFEDSDGRLYKSLESQMNTFKDGEFKKEFAGITHEHEILSELQDNPHIPKIGKVVNTSEGKAFEIERLNEIDKFTQKEYRQIQGILNDLNDKGYHVADRVTVMRRPKTNELVVVDFSSGYKMERGSSGVSNDAVDYMQNIQAKLSPEDKKAIESEDRAEYDKKMDVLFSKLEKNKKQQPNENQNKNITLQNGNEAQNIEQGQNKGDANNIKPLDEKSIKQKLSQIDYAEIAEPYDKVLSYFANDGKIHSQALQKLYGNKRGKSVENERRARISLLGKNAPNIDALAHQLWEADQTGKYDTQDYRNAIEDVILNYNSKSAMAKDLVEKYDFDAAYQKHLSKHGEEFSSIYDNLTEEQINEILRLDADEKLAADLDNYIEELSQQKSKQDALQISSAESVLQHPQEGIGERGSERGRVESGEQGNETTKAQQEEKIEPTKDKDVPLDDAISVQYPPTQLSHQGTEKLRTEFGLEDAPKKDVESFLEWEKEADDKIAKGFDVDALLDKIENKEHTPSKVEHLIMVKQQDAYAKKLRELKNINSPEFDAIVAKAERLNKLSDIAGSEKGRELAARRFRTINNDTLLGYLLQEKEINKGAPLTENQKITAVNEFEKIDAANNEFKKKYEDLQADYAKLLAEREVKKQAANTKKNTKKTHEDYVNDRQSILNSAREKISKARAAAKDPNAPKTQGVGGRTKVDDLITIAPEVAKLAKSYIEEGISKLEDVVKNIHNELKQDISDITEKDVRDMLAGVYNPKKPTRNEVSEQLYNIKHQARLLNKLDDLMSGKKPIKNSRAEEKYNQEVDAIQNQIKEWRKENPDQEAQLQALKKRNETELKKIQEQLDKGDFAISPKKVALSVDTDLKKNFPQAYKEALESQSKLIKAKRERDIRRAEQQFKNLDDREKFRKSAARWLNVPRTLMASYDFSAPLRQAAVATVAHPFTAAKAFKQMFKHGFSQKEYDRWFQELQESPNWDLMNESKLAITDPYNLHLEKAEEDFLGGNIGEKIPLGIGKGVKASERAYVSYLNKMRVDLFNRYAEQFIDNGQTFQNTPELYKSLANFINASTGRGKFGSKNWEAAAPLLNSALFSPRLIASRINLLTNWMNPMFYKKVPFEVRKLYFQDMAKFIGVGITTLALAKQLGAEVSLDPRSSDFGKIKVGNTRYDIWGGFQQYIRAFAQFFTGARKTELGVKDLDDTFGESRAKVLESFARGKLAPIPAMAYDIASRRTSAGEKVNYNFDFPNPENETSFTEMAITHLSPLLIQDVIKASKEDGIKAIFTTGIPATFGIGVQNYEPSKTARQFDLKDTDWQFLLQKTGRLPLLKDSQFVLVDENGKRREMTDKERIEFTELRNKKIKDAIKSLKENGALLSDVDGNVTEVKAAKDMTNEEVKRWVEPITSRATAEAKSELFGDNVDLDKMKIETNE